MKVVLVLLFAAFYSAVQGEDIKKVLPDSKNGSEVESCECVPYYLCPPSSRSTDLTDICPNSSCNYYLDIPCATKHIASVYSSPPAPSSSAQLNECGVRHAEGLSFVLSGYEGGVKTEFGEFPWMALIFHEEEENLTRPFVYQCGGSLIHPQVVITRAQCINKEGHFKVRLGDWDIKTHLEVLPHQDSDVKTTIKHPEFNEKMFFNDIALLVLEKPVEITENVNVVCLPRQDMVVNESECFASGWGKESKDGKYSEILKKLELPIVSSDSCQESFRKTQLGNDFKLHDSFICAGGASSRDICKGDDGSPLVCPIPGLSGRYFQAGIVSWGIGCGDDQTPGVYTNVAKYVDWIDKQLNQQKVDLSRTYYKY